ncbi:MAG: hypothetical protein U9R24_05440 [Thermodesulfobacteriota bacterium]|nr:hypothetical protein [Thermodesulfobacteriota bacterium]
MVVRMKYVSKTCPVCGHEFIVMESLAERELCCTIGCLQQAESGVADRVELKVM